MERPIAVFTVRGVKSRKRDKRTHTKYEDNLNSDFYTESSAELSMIINTGGDDERDYWEYSYSV